MDFRPDDLVTTHTSTTKHRITIVHKATGIQVKGTGENKYALECKLLQVLREKLNKPQSEAPKWL